MGFLKNLLGHSADADEAIEADEPALASPYASAEAAIDQAVRRLRAAQGPVEAVAERRDLAREDRRAAGTAGAPTERRFGPADRRVSAPGFGRRTR